MSYRLNITTVPIVALLATIRGNVGDCVYVASLQCPWHYVEAGAYTAAIACSWANLSTTLKGNAHNLAQNAHAYTNSAPGAFQAEP